MSANLSDYVRPFLRSVLTGGGAGALDAIATVNLTVPVNALVCNGGNAYIYQLIAGTNATSSPTYIRPTDYNGVSNQKVWQLQAFSISGLTGFLDIKGTWDANANSPALASGVGTKGDVWIVSTSGTTNLDGETGWTARDWAYFDGTAWKRVDNTDQDATASIKGVIQLAQDLGGTAAAPIVLGASTTFAITGQLTPSSLSSGSTNDYNPGSLSTSTWLRLTPNLLGSTLTGLQGGAKGRIVVIENIHGSANLTLAANSASSSAANRFDLAADTLIPTKQCALLIYDDVQSLWKGIGFVPAATSNRLGLIELNTDLGGTDGTAPQVSGASGKFEFKGVISPAQITADQNDYAPTSGSASVLWRLNSDAARTITGLSVAPGTGSVKIIHNVGSFPITLSNANTSSSAANRFDMGADVKIQPSDVVMLTYDSTATRWRCHNAQVLRLSGGTLTGRLTLSGPVTNTPSAVTFSSTTNIDFNGAPVQTITVTAALTLTTSNLAAGAMQKVYLIDDGLGPHSLTFPGWKVFGTSLPTATVASKTILLSLESTGTTDANVYATAVSQV